MVAVRMVSCLQQLVAWSAGVHDRSMVTARVLLFYDWSMVTAWSAGVLGPSTIAAGVLVFYDLSRVTARSVGVL